MANKVKYGLSNVYFAVATDDGTGKLTYATPVKWAGAVNLSLDAQGDTNPFYADNLQFFTSSANNGYSGDLESALIPEAFRTAVLGEANDATKGIQYELNDKPVVEFALLFQFEGDVNATRHALYRCTATRPSVSSATSDSGITPTTETVTITAMPRIDDHLVKAKAESTATAYASWFTEVQEPTIA